MPRGGRRAGKVGGKYPNRSDLRGPAPVTTVPSAQYGQRAEQMAAQRAIPIGPPPTDAPMTSPAPAPSGRAPQSTGTLPGELGFADPTARPAEPVTAGVPVGPGAGPDVLGLDDNGAGDLAQYLPMLEFMASQPGASTQTRNFVRRLRANAPVR